MRVSATRGHRLDPVAHPPKGAPPPPRGAPPSPPDRQGGAASSAPRPKVKIEPGAVESKEGGIGRRVEVFWEQEDRWFPGVIIGRRNTSASRVAHHVEYDDGDRQWYHLEANSKDPDSFRFRWLDAHTPAPEGGSSRDPVKPPEPPVYLLDSDDEVDGKAAAGKTTTVFLLDSDDEEDGKAAASNTTTVGGETEWQW